MTLTYRCHEATVIRCTTICLLVLFACRAVSAVPEVTEIRTPNQGLQPQIVADGASVHMLTYEGDPKAGDLFYRRSENGGATFGSAVRVNGQAGSAIALGTIRGGQLALGRGGRVHVAWNGSQTAEPREHDGSPMLYACSDGHGGLPAWSKVAAFTRPDGGFVVMF